MNTDFRQGQKVYFSVSGVEGEGKIVGIASNGVLLIGKTYIVEPDVPFDSNVYPYTHFVCPELYLKPVNS